MTAKIQRCAWARGIWNIPYHDQEWGVPVHDDRRFFEMLILEGAQAGLSWETILRKRESYRVAFDGFDPARVARFTDRDEQRLLQNEGIVRNRLKIASSLTNARAFLEIVDEFGTFDAFMWPFVNGRPIDGRRRAVSAIPAATRESSAMSRELLQRGFRFVGPTICYAFMQAVGMANDHLTRCFRYNAIRRMK